MKQVQKEERHTLSKIVSDSLKQYIIDHDLKPGGKMPSERTLVKIMNVSRPVLREALRSLESSGVLEIRHGEGAFVQNDRGISSLIEQILFMWKLGHRKQSDLLELRRIFEMAAIGEAVRRADSEDFNDLVRLANRMGDVTDTKLIQDADIKFHRRLLNATHSELFIQMAGLIVEYFATAPHRHMDLNERDKSMQEHLQIVEAMRLRDESKAKLLLKEHLDYSKSYLQFPNGKL